MRIRPLIVLSLVLCPAWAEASGKGGGNNLWDNFGEQWRRFDARLSFQPVSRPRVENVPVQVDEDPSHEDDAPRPEGDDVVRRTYAVPYGYGGFRRTGATDALTFFLDTELDRWRRGSGSLLVGEETGGDEDSTSSGQSTPSSGDADEDGGEELVGVSLSLPIQKGWAGRAARLLSGDVRGLALLSRGPGKMSSEGAFPGTYRPTFGLEGEGGEWVDAQNLFALDDAAGAVQAPPQREGASVGRLQVTNAFAEPSPYQDRQLAWRATYCGEDWYVQWLVPGVSYPLATLENMKGPLLVWFQAHRPSEDGTITWETALKTSDMFLLEPTRKEARPNISEAAQQWVLFQVQHAPSHKTIGVLCNEWPRLGVQRVGMVTLPPRLLGKSPSPLGEDTVKNRVKEH